MKMKTFLIGLVCCMAISSGYVFLSAGDTYCLNIG